jgi:hypothetical protein
LATVGRGSSIGIVLYIGRFAYSRWLRLRWLSGAEASRVEGCALSEVEGARAEGQIFSGNLLTFVRLGIISFSIVDITA